MTTPSKKPWRALVTGATGIQGSHLIRKLAQSNDWEKIYAVSRSKPAYEHEKIQHLPINLQTAPIEVLGTLQSKGVRDVTHIFYTAFVETGDDAKNVELNFGMFKTAVEAVERTSAHLQHVYLTTGAKWYGQHLPLNKTPYKEDDPRHFPPNFYYNQEDYLAQRVREGAKWTWNTLRPGPICGFSSGSFMNLVTSTALFGALSKELGMTHLRFPGTETAYTSALDCVDVDLLTEAQIYLSTHPGTDEQSTANTGFNINNGDVTRWKWIWPVVAKHFGLEVGEPQPLPLTTVMKDKAPVWERMQKKHGLREDATWDKLGTWDFAEFVYHQANDWFANTNKLKRAGFTGMRIDTEAMWAAKLQQLSALRVIPSYGIGGSADKNVTVAGLLPPAESQQAGGAVPVEEGDTAIVPTSAVKTIETPATYSGNTGPESAATSGQGTAEGSAADRGEKFNYTEATKAAAQNLAASAQAAKERAAALLHHTAGYAGSTAESAKDTAAATQQRTADAAAAAQQKAKETAAATQQAAVDAANATKQKAAEGYHAAADTAAQTVEAAQQKAAGVWESVKETVVHAKDTTAEYLGAKTQQAKETASDATQTAQQKAAEATEAAKQKAGEAVDTTKQYAGAAQQKAAEGTEAAKQKAGEAVDTGKQYAGAAQQKAGQAAQRTQESADRAGQDYTQAATETTQGVKDRTQGGGGGGGQGYIPAAIERLDQSTEGTGGHVSTGPSGGIAGGGGGVSGGQGYIPASTDRLDQSMTGTAGHLSTGPSGATTHRVHLAGGPPGTRLPSSLSAMEQSVPGINNQGFGGFEYAPGVTGTGAKLTTSEADLARQQAAQDDPTAMSGRQPGALSAVGAELGLDGLKVERAPGGATAARRQEE